VAGCIQGVQHAHKVSKVVGDAVEVLSTPPQTEAGGRVRKRTRGGESDQEE